MKNHINNCLRKELCTGCTACQNTCPIRCISMKADEEGFIHPVVDENICIECQICIKTCPALNQLPAAEIEEAYAMISDDTEERLKSSSGGIMSLLAREILKSHGIVYGAAYDQNFKVVHKRIDNVRGLDSIRRAKYAQSDIQNIFKQVREDLKKGPVLFVGTPCQCAGLYSYLNGRNRNRHSVKHSANIKIENQSDNNQIVKVVDWKNTQDSSDHIPNDEQECVEIAPLDSPMKKHQLYLIDFICHSIPSPIVWENYINWKSEKGRLLSVNQRSKKTGWSRYSYSIELNFQQGETELINNRKDLFMKLFIGDYITRPSCASCNFKGNRRTSDMTLGDFWGTWDTEPEMDDNNGTSLVIVHTIAGQALLDSISISSRSKKIDINEAVNQNPAYQYCCSIPQDREVILSKALNGEFDFLQKALIPELKKQGILKRFFNRLICF